MSIANLGSFNEILKSNKSFTIASHVDPDGDSIGSVLSLTLALKKMGKCAEPVIIDKIPEKYKFLPGNKLISNQFSSRSDVLISLDSSDINRLGLNEDIRDYGNIIVNIDHHKNNALFGDLNIVDSSASSAGEIVYQLIKDKIKIDHDIAINIYTSIITDTGSARYSNTTPLCLRILADLVDIGVKPDYVSRQVFEKRTLSSIKLLKLALDTLELLENNKIAAMYITQEMLEVSKAMEEETEGIINYAREIDGVEVAVLFREKEKSVTKVGLRSNEWVDVSKIAEKFNGGGHLRAAGCIVELPINQARAVVLNAVSAALADNGGILCKE
ncbi:MAG TPA: bifunctional oligoribonuclease/PAP phosphatase NrnA [Tepidanaerobacter syntrophicus]|uniref:DHH family phosphoesterase n=1 Tax=Tepidanaerobacter syntrophicus TaxID=224999 RepID=UPI001751E9F4|nr:bifunctional oligoribonuclease/PAP phosphatase NrnA [Tepidanaerobacter syntrophicus]HHV83576.1 bifunctional oligoribonuclease/PAP phosphatase NrnA [Tepidanaerobacter syntrophicus]